jgi:hypothetical protein
MSKTKDQVRPAAILDLEALEAIRDGLKSGAALASTLTEMGIASSEELTLICAIVEGKSDIALSLLARAVAAAKTKGKTPTKSTTEVLS